MSPSGREARWYVALKTCDSIITGGTYYSTEWNRTPGSVKYLFYGTSLLGDKVVFFYGVPFVSKFSNEKSTYLLFKTTKNQAICKSRTAI